MNAERATYRQAGVDYDLLDAAKRHAVAEALSTSALLARRGGSALDRSRGAPAFTFELAGRTLALVVEGLGTKSLIASAVAEQLGVAGYANIAYDTVAAIVGDLICVGALPAVASAYFATGSSSWYEEEGRAEALVAGWREGCEEAGCAWGGGESPALADLITGEEVELAGSAIGILPEGVEPILGDRLAAGDEIVLVASSGLHANGASLARLVAKSLPEGYMTRLESGRLLGEALLDRSVIYVRLVEALLAAGIVPTYISHITGHGLLKLMRSPRALRYRITDLPPVPEVLAALTRYAQLDQRSAYKTLNMGAGLALCLPAGVAQQALAVAAECGYEALRAGTVEEGERSVLLEPLGVEYAGSELELGGA